ncbi:MAG: glycosyltransferase [Sedimentisphaerales bacterium]|jgi:glycosyltransferase involved in cell wall biosynthesis
MSRMDVICFGGEDWWYHNRGHFDMQLMRRFAKKGTTLYINSIVMQKINAFQGRKFFQKLVRKTKSIFTGLRKTEEGFWVYSPFSLPVQHIRWSKPVNEFLLRSQVGRVARKIGIETPVVWVACPSACDMAVRMNKSRLVYQRTDRFEAFPGVDVETIKDFDRQMKASADLTIYVNRRLYDEEKNGCRKAVLVDHGVDFDLFASPLNGSKGPADLSGIPRPIVGFVGSIDDCNPDIDLLSAVADLLPDVSFVLVGRAQMDCSTLAARKNVWMLGQKPYEQVPEYGKRFDVSVLPLRQSRWAEAVNPLKLKEYLALGKPVVSTPFPELRPYSDVVYEAQAPSAFASCIKRAIAEDGPVRTAGRREKVKDASWDSKAEQVLKELL